MIRGPIQRVLSFLRAHISWNGVGIAVSVCIVAVALTVLYEMLRGIQVREVVHLVFAKRWQDITLAAVFVTLAYVTLTFYDLFALRTLGHDQIRYRTAALAALTSYAIGHNLGASALTGAAVRFRIYSRHGLDAADVAKVCFLAALTFWLGNIAVLGLGIAVAPEAATSVDKFSPFINRTAACILLAVLAFYLIWVWIAPRHIGQGKWRTKLPMGALTVLQIFIGIIDLLLCAGAMYVLLPGRPPIEIVPLAVIFVSATLLGFASHAPGGLGVFEAAMLVALKQFDREALLAGLLMFRLLYYVAPFIIALLLLGGWEILAKALRRTSQALEVKKIITPAAMALGSRKV